MRLCVTWDVHAFLLGLAFLPTYTVCLLGLSHNPMREPSLGDHPPKAVRSILTLEAQQGPIVTATLLQHLKEGGKDAAQSTDRLVL